MKQRIKDLLLSTKREGIEALISAMEEGGFFEAPCSGAYHLCKEGGLAEHSLNVYENLSRLSAGMGAGVDRDSIIICALLHDLGKCGQYGKANYIPNMVKDGRPTKAEPEQKYKISETKPYATNPDLLYIDHAIRSVMMASEYIHLTEEESHAILYHNGKYTHIGYDMKETKLQMLLHFADLWCSRVVEVEEK